MGFFADAGAFEWKKVGLNDTVCFIGFEIF
jgi:hypothetical protein